MCHSTTTSIILRRDLGITNWPLSEWALWDQKHILSRTRCTRPSTWQLDRSLKLSWSTTNQLLSWKIRTVRPNQQTLFRKLCPKGIASALPAKQRVTTFALSRIPCTRFNSLKTKTCQRGSRTTSQRHYLYLNWTETQTWSIWSTRVKGQEQSKAYQSSDRMSTKSLCRSMIKSQCAKVENLCSRTSRSSMLTRWLNLKLNHRLEIKSL